MLSGKTQQKKGSVLVWTGEISDNAEVVAVKVVQIFSKQSNICPFADVVKLVDTADSKSAAERLVGSSPTIRTIGLIPTLQFL